MKKLFISVLAIAGLVACTQETTLVQKGNAPMEFSGAFVENATRADKAADPSTTTESIKGFDVWGFMDSPEGKVFEGEDVTGSQGNFTYVNTQYWIPDHDYYFAALAPMNSANWKLNTDAANTYGAGIVDFHNVDGTEDLLYAAKMLSTKGLEAGEAPENGVVKLQFSHLLSKVKFSFTNGFDNANAKIDVKNVRMEVPAFASINLAVENWWDNDDWTLVEGEKTTLAFGDACANTAINVKQETANERLTIPADATQKYTVTFDVVFYQGTKVAYEGTKTVTIENVALEIGKAYNFKAELNASNITADGSELLPIVFDVEEVKDWVTAEKPDVNVQEAELRAALQLGGEVTLTQDLVITESLVVGAGVSSVINLNGFDIVAESTDAIVVEGANLTINGNGDVKAATNDASSANAIWVKYGNVVINGGNYYVGADNAFRNDCIYLGAASLKAEAANYKSTITINGGTFEAKAKEYDQYWVLNVQDDFYRAGSAIVVKGGSYKNFNPANNKSEGAGTNFVAPGYYSTKIGDNYVVSDAPLVATAEDLQKKLDEAVDGDVIRLAADIEGDVVVSQKADVKVTIDGAGYNYAGVIVVDGKSATYTTAGLTIKNVNFVADSISADAIIRLGNGTDATRYACNVSVIGCTFDVPSAVAVKSYTGGDKNLVISECTASANCHSLLQAAGIDGILVEKSKVLSKNGLNFNNSSDVAIEECVVDTKGYCARFGVNSDGTIAAEYNISNSTLKSACEDGDAVIILRKNVSGSTLNVLNTTLEGTVKFTNAAGAKVYVDGVLM